MAATNFHFPTFKASQDWKSTSVKRLPLLVQKWIQWYYRNTWGILGPYGCMFQLYILLLHLIALYNHDYNKTALRHPPRMVEGSSFQQFVVGGPSEWGWSQWGEINSWFKIWLLWKSVVGVDWHCHNRKQHCQEWWGRLFIHAMHVAWQIHCQ